jgi:hypothetical protein
MMADYYDVMVVEEARNEGGKPWFTKIGRMVPSKNGDGFTLFVTTGVSVSGKLVIRRPLEKREGGQREASKPVHDDDNIPF